MKKVEFHPSDIILAIGFGLLCMIVAFGFGYFVGRAQQIELNKSSLLEIPDINHCFPKTSFSFPNTISPKK